MACSYVGSIGREQGGAFGVHSFDQCAQMFRINRRVNAVTPIEALKVLAALKDQVS